MFAQELKLEINESFAKLIFIAERVCVSTNLRTSYQKYLEYNLAKVYRASKPKYEEFTNWLAT